MKDGVFFAICEGETVVALGKSLGQFSEYQDSGFHFTKQDEKKFMDDEENDFLSTVINCFEENVALPFPESRTH